VWNSIGPNVKLLLERKDDTYCFRLHDDRVYYVRCMCLPCLVGFLPVFHDVLRGNFSETLLKAAGSYPREEVMSFGVSFGKFTKSRKFLLKVTCLEYLAEHAIVRVAV
jgi:60S ribosome subunit biogenesis protein NIP7